MNLQRHGGAHGEERVTRVCCNRHDVGGAGCLWFGPARWRRAGQLARLCDFGCRQGGYSESEIFQEIPTAGAVHLSGSFVFNSQSMFGKSICHRLKKRFWTCSVKLQYIYYRTNAALPMRLAELVVLIGAATVTRIAFQRWLNTPQRGRVKGKGNARYRAIPGG